MSFPRTADSWVVIQSLRGACHGARAASPGASRRLLGDPGQGMWMETSIQPLSLRESWCGAAPLGDLPESLLPPGGFSPEAPSAQGAIILPVGGHRLVLGLVAHPGSKGAPGRTWTGTVLTAVLYSTQAAWHSSSSPFRQYLVERGDPGSGLTCFASFPPHSRDSQLGLRDEASVRALVPACPPSCC